MQRLKSNSCTTQTVAHTAMGVPSVWQARCKLIAHCVEPRHSAIGGYSSITAPVAVRPGHTAGASGEEGTAAWQVAHNTVDAKQTLDAWQRRGTSGEAVSAAAGMVATRLCECRVVGSHLA